MIRGFPQRPEGEHNWSAWGFPAQEGSGEEIGSSGGPLARGGWLMSKRSVLNLCIPNVVTPLKQR